MARQGLFLQKEGIAWGLVRFQPGEPKEVEYRLVSRRKPQMLWKRFLFGNPEEYLDGPKEEEVDLFARFGWVYLSKCGNFFVYQAEGEQVLEVDSDPRVQAISIQAVRDQEIASALNLLFVLFVNYTINIKVSLFTILSRGWLPYFIPVFLLPLWLFFLSLLQVCTLDRLRRKLARGVPLDRKKPWRPRSGLHYIKCAGSLLVVLGFVVTCSYVYLGDDSLFEDHYDVQDYPEDPPFPTVEDLYSDTEITSHDGMYCESKSLIIPVYVDWWENGVVYPRDEVYYHAYYYETLTPAIARELAEEILYEDQGDYAYAADALPDLDVDYGVIYDHEETVILQEDTKVLRVTMDQGYHREIPLAVWTATLAQSLQSDLS